MGCGQLLLSFLAQASTPAHNFLQSESGERERRRRRTWKVPTRLMISWAGLNAIRGQLARTRGRSPRGLLRHKGGKSLLWLEKKEEAQLTPLQRFYFNLFCPWNQISSTLPTSLLPKPSPNIQSLPIYYALCVSHDSFTSHPLGWLLSTHQENNQCWWGCGGIETLCMVSGRAKCWSHYGKHCGASPKN